MQRDERSRWGRRRTWQILKQRAYLGVQEGPQMEWIVDGIPLIQFIAREVECSQRERPNKLEGVETRCPKRCRTMCAPPESRLGPFEVSRLSGNDAKNCYVVATFVLEIWGQNIIPLHHPSPQSTPKPLKTIPST